MTLGIATLILAILIIIGAYSVKKALKEIIEKRFDKQETALDEIKEELNSARMMRENLEDRLLSDNDKEPRENQFGKQEEALDNLRERIDDVRGMLKQLEWRSLSESEKEFRRYENAMLFTLDDVRKLKSAQVVKLISCSYFFPDDNPFIEEFYYKHDHIAEDQRTKWGLTVKGFTQEKDYEDKWKPYEFLASKKECSTSSCCYVLGGFSGVS